MAGRKRSVNVDEALLAPDAKRRAVSVKTVEKWISENEKGLSTAMWLVFERTDGDRYHVARLKCSVCTRFKRQLEGMRNYNPAFIDGSTNVKTSSFKDHASTEMHKKAMNLHKKSESNYSIQTTPIAKALYRIDSATLTTTKKKFDIAYFIAKEGLPFTKMAPLCQLEERHGVNLGTGYKNNQACTQFVEFIAKVEQQNLLSKAHFFSLQADGSTDCATIEDEMYLCLFFDSNGVDGRVHVRDVFFAVRRPEATDA